MSVYDSIIAGLTEAIEDVRSEQETLKRHTVEIEEEADSVVLIGEAALSFANSLFRPAREETKRRNAVMEKIDSDVTITEYKDGFSANVSWLDLSSLEDESSFSGVELVLTITGNIPYVFVGVKSKRKETAGGELFSCAA